MSALLNYIAVVYIIIGAAWRVKCYDCGFTVDKGNRVRHDAQVNWNEAVKV